MKALVLMINDQPCGIYWNQTDADKAAVEDWKRRVPKHEGLKLGEVRDNVGSTSFTVHRYYYWHREFEIGAEAQP